MRRTLGLSAIFLSLLLLARCAPMWKQGPVERPSQPIISPPVEPTLVQERIDKIEKALRRKDMTASERTTLYSLLEAYREIANPPPGQGGRDYYRDSIRKLFYGMSSLEDLYLSRRPQLEGKASSIIGAFSEKTNEAFDAYVSGNYKAVVDLCIGLKETFGPDALGPDIGLIFAMSLAHQGMIKDAIAIGEQIANKLGTRPDLIILRAHLAQWHLKVGDREAALRNFEKLQDLLDERERTKADLAAALGPIPPTALAKEVNQPQLPVSHEENPGQAQKLSMIPLDEFFSQIQGLLKDRKFERARDMIKRRRHQTTSREELERLSDALKQVDAQEDRFLQERISVLSEQTKVLREAQSLIEAERYDEALSKLSLLNGGSVDNLELTRLKNAAEEGIINRERNKAARLFLAAKKCQDPEKKERYLKSCLEILKALVHRFPSSPLIYKVKDHIQKVTSELDKLG